MVENKSDRGFWAIVGFFVSLWGILELGYATSLMGNFWQASGRLLWGGFLLAIGAYLMVLIVQSIRTK
jgi:hypothetical protein